MKGLPEFMTPQHSAANLKLFVETCASHKEDVPKDQQSITMALAHLLPTGRHYWFDGDVCRDIQDRLVRASDDDIEKMLNSKPNWTLMPGPSFFSFSRPFKDALSDRPLLGFGMLPQGVIGWLAASPNPDPNGGPLPFCKFTVWPNEMDWLTLKLGTGNEDKELDWWAILTILTMGAGGDYHHQQIEFAGKEGHSHFRLDPEGGMFAVSLADITPYPYDGSSQARLN